MGDVLMGPMMSERFVRRFEEDWLGLIRGHHTVHGPAGRITPDNPRGAFTGEAGLYVHPTIVSGVRADDDLANTETFGPLVGVASFGSWEEAMALANGHGYGLSSAIYTRDPATAFRFREQITAGMVSVNNSTSGAEAHLAIRTSRTGTYCEVGLGAGRRVVDAHHARRDLLAEAERVAGSRV